MDKRILIICEKRDDYRGIEREFSFFQKNVPLNVLLTIMELHSDSEEIRFTAQNLECISRIQRDLKEKKTEFELILVGERFDDEWCNENGYYSLGYDVSGESYYHSPVFRTFFEENEIGGIRKIKEQYASLLNENGLFDRREDAESFAKTVKDCESEFYEEREVKPLEIRYIS